MKTAMKQVGDIIPETFRNCGASLGLDYPYIFAHDLANWIIWHRHTGEIVHVETEPNSCIAEHQCSDKCHQLNGLEPWPSAEVLADIDATP
jgi:hypothetical protein